METLELFYNNEPAREAVKGFLNQCAEEWVLNQLKDDKSGVGYSTAVKIINDAFTKLDEEYGKKAKGDNKNQAK